MQELLAQSSFDKLKEGAIVPGTITEIRQNEVVVDIGGKSEGVIPANEFIDIGELQIGSTIEVMVEKLEDKSGAPDSKLVEHPWRGAHIVDRSRCPANAFAQPTSG